MFARIVSGKRKESKKKAAISALPQEKKILRWLEEPKRKRVEQKEKKEKLKAKIAEIKNINKLNISAAQRTTFNPAAGVVYKYIFKSGNTFYSKKPNLSKSQLGKLGVDVSEVLVDKHAVKSEGVFEDIRKRKFTLAEKKKMLERSTKFFEKRDKNSLIEWIKAHKKQKFGEKSEWSSINWFGKLPDKQKKELELSEVVKSAFPHIKNVEEAEKKLSPSQFDAWKILNEEGDRPLTKIERMYENPKVHVVKLPENIGSDVTGGSSTPKKFIVERAIFTKYDELTSFDKSLAKIAVSGKIPSGDFIPISVTAKYPAKKHLLFPSRETTTSYIHRDDYIKSLKEGANVTQQYETPARAVGKKIFSKEELEEMALKLRKKEIEQGAFNIENKLSLEKLTTLPKSSFSEDATRMRRLMFAEKSDVNEPIKLEDYVREFASSDAWTRYFKSKYGVQEHRIANNRPFFPPVSKVKVRPGLIRTVADKSAAAERELRRASGPAFDLFKEKFPEYASAYTAPRISKVPTSDKLAYSATDAIIHRANLEQFKHRYEFYKDLKKHEKTKKAERRRFRAKIARFDLESKRKKYKEYIAMPLWKRIITKSLSLD